MALYSKWHDAGREPQCAPNPAYPDGIDLVVGTGPRMCATNLPYPAKRCGHYLVGCTVCGQRIAITTAGRPDDPRSIKMECRK